MVLPRNTKSPVPGMTNTAGHSLALDSAPSQAVTGAPLWSRPVARTVLARDEAVPPGGLESCTSGCILVVLLRTPADGSAKCAVYPHGLESQLLPHVPHPGAGGGRPGLVGPRGA